MAELIFELSQIVCEEKATSIVMVKSISAHNHDIIESLKPHCTCKLLPAARVYSYN